MSKRRRDAKRGAGAFHPSTTTSERLNSSLIVEVEIYNKIQKVVLNFRNIIQKITYKFWNSGIFC